ncbi:3'-5' exonuclease [Streptomyces brasiliscabiei]|uniref:3'-5' exonuclease n=1 Tax=Streptomyces brasiliscabiei TaxID=2736302 RepID=UPI001C102CB4|nr:hypothetical protein [Streptomyces brasiliscabiei]
MTLPIAFVDCETTHLDAEIGEAWEVAVILRAPNGDPTTDTEYVWEFSINPETVDPEALRIGRWHERRQLPARTALAAFTGAVPAIPMPRAEAVEAIVDVLSGAVLVGSNPGFDDRFLRKLLGPGSAQWHYRPYDIVQLAAARIGAQAAGPLPWRTHVLSRAVGVEPPTEDAAHTALGDARWARDVYDAAMVQEKFPMSWEGRARHAIGLFTKTAVELEDAERERDEHKENYLSACGTIAAMHKAAVGEVRGPHRGVVEDVADVRERAEKIRKALHVHLHALRARPGREITTDFVRAVLERLIEHPDETCDLADGRALCPTEDSEHQALRESDDAPSLPVSPDQTALNIDHGLAANKLPSFRDYVVKAMTAWCQDVSAATGDTVDAAEVRERAHELVDDLVLLVNGEADDQDDQDEEAGDADGDVFELISEIAGRLRDATDRGEYHAVGLIADLANGRTTIADARGELDEITFRHV